MRSLRGALGPAAFGCIFFLVYQESMAWLLFAGREMPPVNDNLYYVYRVSRVMEGAWVNDSSILFTYATALVGWGFGLGAFAAFRLVAFAGPFICAAVLWQLFSALRLSSQTIGAAFFLLAFYCNIGPHTFVHFVPSTLAVLVSYLWFSRAVDPKPRSLLLTGLGVNILLILSHASGIYMALINLALILALEARPWSHRLTALVLSGLAAVVAATLLFKFVDFDPLFPRFDAESWILPDRLAEFLAERGDTGYSYDFGSGLTQEARLTRLGLWWKLLNGYFFQFVFPVRAAWVVVPVLLFYLGRDAWRLEIAPIRNRYFLVWSAGYFLLFVGMAFLHERGARMVEFWNPLAFVWLAILLVGIRRRVFRGLAFALVSLYLGFLSYNFTVSENANKRALGAIPEAARTEMRDGVVFFVGQDTASYLLANGLDRIQDLRFLPYFKPASGKFYYLTLLDCPSSEPSNWVRRAYQLLKPEKPRTSPSGSEPPLAPGYHFQDWLVSESCYRVRKISVQ